MGGGGEAVDDGVVHPLGVFLHDLVAEGADEQAVVIAVEHAGGVLQGFAAAALQLVGAQIDGGNAQIRRRALESVAGAGGVFLEQSGPHLPLEVFMGLACDPFVFQFKGQVGDELHLFAVQILESQKVFASEILSHKVFLRLCIKILSLLWAHLLYPILRFFALLVYCAFVRYLFLSIVPLSSFLLTWPKKACIILYKFSFRFSGAAPRSGL